MAYNRLLDDKKDRLSKVRSLRKTTSDKVVDKKHTVELLENIIKSNDRVCLEGDNQKQADFLAESLCKLNPVRVNNLHMVQSSLVLGEHLDLFEKGIASKVDFAFSGPVSTRLAELVNRGIIKMGDIHTYLELHARYFLDLTPRVSLVAAMWADKQGNLYTGHNTEDTPTICEATAFKQGIVVAQVKDIRDSLPRVDIPGSWVDIIISTGKEPYIEPLFTRNPEGITEIQIFLAMLVIKGIYQPYKIKSLNHGIGYAPQAIELLLPTYARHLKGQICTHWVLNPHPTLIPAIEEGFVESIHSFGSEPGMEEYCNNRQDIFFCGEDGTMRSSRTFCQLAGLYGIDCFLGATLQIDRYGNSSTATRGKISGFGGAPNLGCSAPGRRHETEAYMKAGAEDKMLQKSIGGYPRGRKIVVQITPTISEKKKIPVFVEELDAVSMWKAGRFNTPPVMIYGDQITHIVTEKGIAYLNRCAGLKERMSAIRAVAGETPLGRQENLEETRFLKKKKIIITPEQLAIDRKQATRKLLAAKSFEDIVRLSGGLYHIPTQYINKHKS